MSEAEVKPVITGTVVIKRAPAPHADHDPALECEPADAPEACHLIERRGLTNG